MTRVQGHLGRSLAERRAVNQLISSENYTPTVEESGGFDASTDMGESLAEPTARRPRPGVLSTQIREHFASHWIEWVIGGAVLIGGYFVVESKIHFADVDRSIQETRTNITELKESLKSVQSTVEGNALTAQETRVRMEQTQSLVQMLVENRLQQGNTFNQGDAGMKEASKNQSKSNAAPLPTKPSP